MEQDIIERYIEKANPWWHAEFKFSLEYKEREIYKKIIKFFPSRLIISLTGLRRVGKTTLMMQIMKQKIEEGFNRNNFFYFSFDEFSDIRIMDLIDIYEKIIGKIDSSNKYIFLFDEIQKVKDWSEQLKSVFDLYPNIKLIISGSESLFIRKNMRESLGGRIFEFKINPLSFKEFMNFRAIKINNFFLQKEKIIENFKQYLITNGFPEIINVDEEEATKYIKEGIIDKTIYRDLSEILKIKNISLLKSIFNVIYNNPGQIIEIQSLAKELGVSRQIVSNYLEYLEDAFLIKKLYNFSRNARKTERKLKKYYSTLANNLLIKSNFSKIFEQFIVIQLDASFFWRDVFKNEVDIIQTDPLIAIEIKSGKIKENDLESLEKFIHKFNPKDNIIISYDTEKKIKKIKVIPFYKFLLDK